MIEWALPVNRQIEYDALVHELEHDPRWQRIKSFMSGGFWRNFKVKYAETNHMYARMMYVSRLLNSEPVKTAATKIFCPSPKIICTRVSAIVPTGMVLLAVSICRTYATRSIPIC